MYVCNKGGDLFFEETELFFKGIYTLCRLVVCGKSITLVLSVVIVGTAILIERVALSACLRIFAVRCRRLQGASQGGGGSGGKFFRNKLFHLFFSNLDAIR